MDRLRRSFRDSFRRRKGGAEPESARPHQWHADEAAVRAAAAAFPVKYLGCVEVFESRGMQVCEEALKVLRNSRRRPVRAILHVSGDGLRVVEEETKGLIVDQTIEKVSFCAPDRNHERGFSYICRDGTTRRWMCHGFLAARDGGERLSHAVGCAFAACLERKQRRDKECAVSMSIDAASHAFTRQGSFRQTSVTESRRSSESAERTSPPPVPPARTPHNPFAIERPHAAPHMLERQGSFRGFAHLNNNSPFKRQMSLRISDLPSNLERQRISLTGPPAPPSVSPVPEVTDPVAAMCQQLSQGLQALTANDANANNTAPNLNTSFSSQNTYSSQKSYSPIKTTALEETPALSPLPPVPALPDPEQWLGKISASPRAPPLSAQTRAKSFAGVELTNNMKDPFNSEWHPPGAKKSTNPFLPQTYPVNM